jgi:hypothetical protein
MEQNIENDGSFFKGYEKMSDNTKTWSDLPHSSKKVQWCVTEKGLVLLTNNLLFFYLKIKTFQFIPVILSAM